jgi:hypothetical protein
MRVGARWFGPGSFSFFDNLVVVIGILKECRGNGACGLLLDASRSEAFSQGARASDFGSPRSEREKYRCFRMGSARLPAMIRKMSEMPDIGFAGFLRAFDSGGQATKGAWGMSWRQEAAKGAEGCDKPGVTVKQVMIPGFPN